MFFNYTADAPIYHYPITTSVLIVINVFVHILIVSTGYDITPWILIFGDGFHPLQWVSHVFLHIGWIHLIGNMIFLFPFGLIIEGKIGWLRMLVLYLAIGAGQGFIQQLIMLPSGSIDNAEELVAAFNSPDSPFDEETKEQLRDKWRSDLLLQGFGSLGATAVIFGLLAVCAVWAPLNSFEIFFRWSPIHSEWDFSLGEWPMTIVGGIFVTKEFLLFLMTGIPFSSEALYLNGAILGAVFGLAMLQLGFVDCEGYDIVSAWTGTKFKGTRVLEVEHQEELEAIEEAKPKGPPRAVVPTMAHDIKSDDPYYLSSDPPPAATQPRKAKPSRPEPTRPPARDRPIAFPLAADPSLPQFDDGIRSADALTETKTKIDTMIATGQFYEASRLLTAAREQDPSFLLVPVSIGRLAEGLIEEDHVQEAITLMLLGGETYPAFEPKWRLRIASLEVSANKDPIAAIKQLSLIDKEMLDSSLRDQYLKIGRIAKQLAGQ